MPLATIKTVEELIKRVRRETRNATVGSTTAGSSIKDAEFIDQLNDGQELCVETITGVFSTLFERTKIYTIDTSVANYEELDLPDYLLLGTRIASVEYSYSGNAEDYKNIYPLDIRERYTGTSVGWSLMGYMLSGNKLILSEQPRNGAKVRVVYELAPPRLDVLKARLTSGSRSGTDYSGGYSTSASTTVDTDGDGTTDIAEWDNGDYVTVINRKTKTVIIRDGVFSALDTGAGTFTIDLTDATYTAATVDAQTATDLALIEGGRSNIPEMPDYAEKFITNYAILKIKVRDSSKLAREFMSQFDVIQRSLERSYIQAIKDWPAVSEAGY